MQKVAINFSKYIADDRKQIADMLIQAINYLIEDDSALMDAMLNISEYYEDRLGSYPVVFLSKDDIRDKGYNPAGLTNEDMRNLAQKMHTDDLGESFWYALESTAEEMQLPELRTEIDDLYNEYVLENSKKPLFADIWMEDAGGNNQPWRETVKLSLDVYPEEDEEIYMYFNGYDELKGWLYGTLNEDNKDSDRWCYDEPQHRIVFYSSLKI